jgi:hypothetical protein
MTLPHVLLAAAGYLAAVGGLSLLMRGEVRGHARASPAGLVRCILVWSFRRSLPLKHWLTGSSRGS